MELHEQLAQISPRWSNIVIDIVINIVSDGLIGVNS